MDLKVLGSRIRRLRRVRRLTQGDLANLMGVRRQQVSVWENGHQHISTPNLLRLYDVLGVSPEQFWDEDYIPGGLPLNRSAPTTGGVIGAGVPEVDERQRALRCPRCGAHKSSTSDVNDDAVYCYSCAFPMYNLCSGSERHINPAHARFCGTCGARTFWAMTEDELAQAGVPPLPRYGRNTRNNGSCQERR